MVVLGSNDQKNKGTSTRKITSQLEFCHGLLLLFPTSVATQNLAIRTDLGEYLATIA